MTHTGKSAGQHNDNNDKDVMGYALPRRENEPVQVGRAVRDNIDSFTMTRKTQPPVLYKTQLLVK
jgi:hypothetical protein